MDWIMRKTTAEKRGGIRWNLTTVLEDLVNFRTTWHDFHLMTCVRRLGDWRRKQPEKALNLMRESARHWELSLLGTGRALGWMVRKWKMSKSLRTVRAIVDKEGGGSKDIRNRMWAARGIGRRSKIRVFKTLVRLMIIKKTDERKLNSFQCQCLRRILRNRMQQKMTNSSWNDRDQWN